MGAESLWHSAKHPRGQPTLGNSLVELESRIELLVHFVITSGRLDVSFLAQHMCEDLHECWRGFLIFTVHHTHFSTAPTLPVTDILGQGHRLSPGQKGSAQIGRGESSQPLPLWSNPGILWPYLQPLISVALRAIPLDNELAQVQQEHVPLVEAVPAHLHLQQDGIGGSEGQETGRLVRLALQTCLPHLSVDASSLCSSSLRQEGLLGMRLLLRQDIVDAHPFCLLLEDNCVWEESSLILIPNSVSA